MLLVAIFVLNLLSVGTVIIKLTGSLSMIPDNDAPAVWKVLYTVCAVILTIIWSLILTKFIVTYMGWAA